MVHQLPVVDFNDFENRSSIIAQEVLDACKTIGFFYVVNHQIPKEMIEEAFALVLIFEIDFRERKNFKSLTYRN